MTTEMTESEVNMNALLIAAGYADPSERAESIRRVFAAQESQTLRERVKAFHVKFGHPVANTAAVPDPEKLRFRMKLIFEEFWEAFEAATGCNSDPERSSRWVDAFEESQQMAIYQAQELIEAAIEKAPFVMDVEHVQFPMFIDALDDLDYVIEGTRLVCGVDRRPTARAVHEANMAKEPVLREDGTPDPGKKPTKPAGWKEPNTAAMLERQGWVRP